MFVAMLPFLYSLELHLNARDIPLCQGNSGSGMCSSGGDAVLENMQFYDPECTIGCSFE